MPTILPVTELRNYTKVLCEVSPGNPVFLTKNGRGLYAVVDMEDYKKQSAIRQLMAEIAEGELSARDKRWLPMACLSMPSASMLHEIKVAPAAHADFQKVAVENDRTAVLHLLRAASHLPQCGTPLYPLLLIPSDCQYLSARAHYPVYRLEGNALCVLRILSGKQPLLASHPDQYPDTESKF